MKKFVAGESTTIQVGQITMQLLSAHQKGLKESNAKVIAIHYAYAHIYTMYSALKV